MSATMFCILLLFVGASFSVGVPLDRFFPFGYEANDSSIEPNRTWDEAYVSLPSHFPYFDENHRNICIKTNGLIGFGFDSIGYFPPTNLSVVNGTFLLAPFWSDPNVNESNEVFYQVYSFVSPSNISTRIAGSVRAFFPQQRPFAPTLAIITTWNQTNYTFQAVLSTDGDRSFVFLLYHNLHHYAHINGSVYPRVGFMGDRHASARELLHSGTKDVGLLTSESNVNGPGLFVFRIDTERINNGGCDEDPSTAYIRPRLASPFGSTAVIVSGPCLSNRTVQCQFGSLGRVQGLIVDRYRAICLSPFASTYGPVQVNISIDGNSQKTVSGPVFTYAPMQFGSDEVKIHLNSTDDLLVAGRTVELNWQFPEAVRSLFPSSTQIDIQFWEVRSDTSSGLQKNDQPHLLATNLVLATSAYTFQWPSNISQSSTGFIRVLAQSNGTAYAGLNTGLLTVRSSSSAAKQSCQAWANNQPKPSTWNQGGLLQCPMTRWQAIAGGFCCYQSDRHCQMNSANPKNCWLHQGRASRNETSAVDCYLSIASNSDGAGTECCYDKDSYLITRGRAAGTDNRHHPLRQPVKHFFDDVLPYLQCCVMSDDDDLCETYLTYRPARAGSNTMGDTGRMWGDPHLGTLDGASYTFNGYGEYVYLAISNKNSFAANFNSSDPSLIFVSQIRTEPLQSTRATVATGFAARSTDGKPSANVSLTITSNQQIVLHRDGERLEFENNNDRFVFPEMTIERAVRDRNDHFILTWSIGVSVDIKVVKVTKPSEQLFFEIGASVSNQHRIKTYGLLGFYDGNSTNDLQNRVGQLIARDASEEEIFRRFGQTWSIESSTSLLAYERGRNADYFKEQIARFQPDFLDVNSSIPATNPTAAQICGINRTIPASAWTMAQRSCYIDYSITGNDQLAITSLAAGDRFTQERNERLSVPVFNEKLPLRLDLGVGEEVNLTFSATTEQRANSVTLSAVHLPKNAIFNSATGLFVWQTIKGEHYVRIQAKDTVSNRINHHDVSFHVKSSATSALSSRPSLIMTFPLLTIALIYLFA